MQVTSEFVLQSKSAPDRVRNSRVVYPPRVELGTAGVGGRNSIQLNYGYKPLSFYPFFIAFASAFALCDKIR